MTILTIRNQIKLVFGLDNLVKEFYIHCDPTLGGQWINIVSILISTQMKVCKMIKTIFNGYALKMQGKAAKPIWVKMCSLTKKIFSLKTHKNTQTLWCSFVLFQWLHLTIPSVSDYLGNTQRYIWNAQLNLYYFKIVSS